MKSLNDEWTSNGSRTARLTTILTAVVLVFALPACRDKAAEEAERRARVRAIFDAHRGEMLQCKKMLDTATEMLDRAGKATDADDLDKADRLMKVAFDQLQRAEACVTEHKQKVNGEIESAGITDSAMIQDVWSQWLKENGVSR